MTKEQLLLATKNRAISRCWLSHTSYGQIAAATAGLLWPVGTVVAGVWGIAAMGGFAGVILIGSVMSASREADAIDLEVSEGKFERMGQYLTQDDVLDIKRQAISMGVSSPEKKMSPNTGQTQEPTSGNGTATPDNGANAEPPKPTAPPLTQKTPSWPDGEHLFMVGLSGGAKTTVLQGITANIATPVVYLTIKSDDTAPPDWVAYRLDKFGSEKLLRQLDWLIGTLETWARQGKKHRLIIDEYVSLRDTAKTACKPLDRKDELKGVADRFEALVKVYIRAGRSDGHYLGLLSQTPNGTDNFDSAKTQQGLRVFLCASERSSEKFRFFVPWAKQMFADLITHEAEQHLRDINSGFWHLFADGGQLVLNATPAPTVETVPCQECPTAGFVRKPEPETETKQSLEDRIVGWLAQRTEPEPAWMIRNYCTDKSDRDRPDVLAIKDLLATMPQVRRVVMGKTEKYEVAT